MNNSDSNPKFKLDLIKYSEQIWLAGLGAFSRAEEEGQRFFEQLVKIGQELEGKSQEVVGEVRGTVESHISDVASTTRSHLETAVQQTTSIINNVPAKSTEQLVNVIESLHKKVDSLLQEVENLKKP